MPVRSTARVPSRIRSSGEVAARLLVSHRTVGHHLGSVYPKLGVTSRAELARIDMAGDLRFRTPGHE